MSQEMTGNLNFLGALKDLFWSQNKDLEYVELPLDSGAEVFIDFKMNIPNSEYGLKIDFSPLNENYANLNSLTQTLAREIINHFKEKFAIHTEYYFKPVFKGYACEVGFKIQMRSLDLFKLIEDKRNEEKKD